MTMIYKLKKKVKNKGDEGHMPLNNNSQNAKQFKSVYTTVNGTWLSFVDYFKRFSFFYNIADSFFSVNAEFFGKTEVKHTSCLRLHKRRLFGRYHRNNMVYLCDTYAISVPSESVSLLRVIVPILRDLAKNKITNKFFNSILHMHPLPQEGTKKCYAPSMLKRRDIWNIQ